MNGNKRKFLRIAVAVTAFVFLVFPAKRALPGDPVPGIDVQLEQIPGGKAKVVRTDKDGKFTFANLAPGKYVLKLVPMPMKAENHNTSRSNKSQLRPSSDGSTHWDVSITLIKTGRKKPFEPIELTIGPKGGKTTGRVEWEVAIKEEGVK